MLSFILEPQDNARLQSLCGAFDDHLKLIEKEFNLVIARHNFTFNIDTTEEDQKPHHAKLIKSAVKLIQDLYVETAPVKGKVKELDLEDVHMALQESRMLSQVEPNRAENNVFSTTIKTKRGVIKPRGENQVQYLHNILTHDISFGIGPAGTGKTFLAVAAAVAPLAYMRGRTLNDSFIILDESQNTTVEQMKMFLTRIGFNSKAVITGDITQIDLPRSTKSGLRHAIEVLEKVPELSFNYFDSKDIVRHPVVAKVVQAYEEWEVQDEIRRKELSELRKAEREKERSEIEKNLGE